MAPVVDVIFRVFFGETNFSKTPGMEKGDVGSSQWEWLTPDRDDNIGGPGDGGCHLLKVPSPPDSKGKKRAWQPWDPRGRSTLRYGGRSYLFFLGRGRAGVGCPGTAAIPTEEAARVRGYNTSPCTSFRGPLSHAARRFLPTESDASSTWEMP